MAEKKDLPSLLGEAQANIGSIDAERALEQLKSKQAVFIDVREEKELRSSGVIPGAHHAARGMLEFLVDSDSPYHNEIFDKDKKYIVYCASGGRSALAAWTMKQMGLENSQILKGGMREWKERGYDVASFT